MITTAPFRLALAGLTTAFLLAACGPSEPASPSSASPLAAQLQGLAQPIEAMRTKLRDTLRDSLRSANPDLEALQRQITVLSIENHDAKARLTAKADTLAKMVEQFRTNASDQVGEGKVDPASMTHMADLAHQYEHQAANVTARLTALQHELDDLSDDITIWRNTVFAARQVQGEEEAGKLARQLIQRHLDGLQDAGH